MNPIISKENFHLPAVGPVIIMLLLSIGGCATKSRLSNSSRVESGGLVFSPQWVKRKNKVVDLGLLFENKSDEPIYIKRSSFQLRAGGMAGALRNKAGSYPVMGGSPHAMHVVAVNVVPENIEISPRGSFSEMLAFRYAFKLPDGVPLELQVSGVYEGTPEKTGPRRPLIKIPILDN